MSQSRRKKRPEQPDAPAAFQRFQKLTKALLGVSKEEYDQKRAEYDRQAQERRKRRAAEQVRPCGEEVPAGHVLAEGTENTHGLSPMMGAFVCLLVI